MQTAILSLPSLAQLLDTTTDVAVPISMGNGLMILHASADIGFIYKRFDYAMTKL